MMVGFKGIVVYGTIILLFQIKSVLRSLLIVFTHTRKAPAEL